LVESTLAQSLVLNRCVPRWVNSC